jgi:hypothetical protein
MKTRHYLMSSPNITLVFSTEGSAWSNPPHGRVSFCTFDRWVGSNAKALREWVKSRDPKSPVKTFNLSDNPKTRKVQIKHVLYEKSAGGEYDSQARWRDGSSWFKSWNWIYDCNWWNFCAKYEKQFELPHRDKIKDASLLGGIAVFKYETNVNKLIDQDKPRDFKTERGHGTCGGWIIAHAASGHAVTPFCHYQTRSQRATKYEWKPFFPLNRGYDRVRMVAYRLWEVEPKIWNKTLSWLGNHASPTLKEVFRMLIVDSRGDALAGLVPPK